MPFGGAPKCPLCKKSVYAAEKATGPGGDWHKSCLKCPDCNKLLDSTTLCEHEGLVYCKADYGKRFGPKGFGFAGGGAMMHTDGGGATPVNRQPASQPAAASSVTPKFCSNCGNKFTQSNVKFCPGCGTKV
eukprot:CAMPEP_0201506882 /NCGR_PEP_ID=MMETSP0161_2-20130828/721_1 /ASSEMBLY_ACC=CAM_ASM_000251 /TAXON_ID=180227 /ORGANISM="Neoparamoeba aestuarina, Strain SoJaBio B1-5/56/2" /LENGTH=130 /DNA_ID=CAMNT_0047901117 /DNA_START=87 /DNA_END=479 /DNA_ORIENTATION=-